jgi:transposase
MAGRSEPALVLRGDDRVRLSAWTQAASVSTGLTQRAMIVLLASDGVSNTKIAAQMRIPRSMVIACCARYERLGVIGLEDDPHSGHPTVLDHRAIIAATLTAPPNTLQVTHWTSRLLAKHLEIGNSTVVRVWHEYGVQPWGERSFRFFTNPPMVGDVSEVVGLYLAPPDNSVVLCVKGAAAGPTVDHTPSSPPAFPGSPERETPHCIRRGPTSLLTALEIATERRKAIRTPRDKSGEFGRFVKQVGHVYPDHDLVIVRERHARHKLVEVHDWLAANPRVRVHFATTSPWLNLVDAWLQSVELQPTHPRTAVGAEEVAHAIRAFINSWNPRIEPFLWTASPT